MTSPLGESLVNPPFTSDSQLKNARIHLRTLSAAICDERRNTIALTPAEPSANVCAAARMALLVEGPHPLTKMITLHFARNVFLSGQRPAAAYIPERY